MSKVQFKDDKVLFGQDKVVITDYGADEGYCCCCDECHICSDEPGDNCTGNIPSCPDGVCCTPKHYQLVLSGFDDTITACLQTSCFNSANIVIEVDGTYGLVQRGSCSWGFHSGSGGYGTGTAPNYGGVDIYDGFPKNCDAENYDRTCVFDAMYIDLERATGPDEMELYITIDSQSPSDPAGRTGTSCSNWHPSTVLIVGTHTFDPVAYVWRSPPDAQPAATDHCNEDFSWSKTYTGTNECFGGLNTFANVVVSGSITITRCPS